jgi:uncharacterized membrane protein
VIEPRDVVIAILGASAALAGFVLVFLGVMIASYQSYSGGVSDQVVQPYRTVGVILLAAFGLCLLSVLVGLIWLVGGGPNETYGLTVGLFVVEVPAVFAAAVWTTRMVLWR